MDIDAEVEAVAQQLAGRVAGILKIPVDAATELIDRVGHLYMARMTERFTDIRFSERLKRTNPFLLQVRGVRTVKQWAENQVMSALFASEEEAIGHVLEMIAKACHPHAQDPLIPDDFDFEVIDGKQITGYQIKMSWDCMPMSSRKNLSNTIRRLEAHYGAEGKQFIGVFAPCYGKRTTTRPPGQAYVSMRSRDFWQEVGGGDPDYDIRVGDVCRMLCAEFREELAAKTIPLLVEKLTTEGCAAFGTSDGEIDRHRLFRLINR